MRRKISKYLVSRISLVLLTCAIIASLIVHNLYREQSTSEWVDHSNNEIDLIEKTFELMQDYETAARGFVITNDSSFERPLKNADKNLPPVISQLRTSVEDDVIQKRNLNALTVFLDRKIRLSRLQIETRKKQGLDSALHFIATGAGQVSMDSIRSRVDAMITRENAQLQQRRTENREAVMLTNFTLLTMVSISLLLLVLLSLKLWKGVKAKRAVETNLKDSNERFNFVSKATVDAVWDWDLKSETLLWGDNFEILFGHRLDNKTVNITYWDNLLHPEDKDRVIEGMQGVIDSKQNIWKDEYRFLRADGTYAYIIDRAILIRDEAGEAYRMIGSMRDITERKEAELKIEESEARYRQIVETAQEGIWMVDAERKTVFVNKRMCEMLEYSPEELQGEPDTAFMDDEGRELVKKNKLIRIAGVTEQGEMKFITKSGKKIWTSAAITTNIDNKGRLVSAMAMITDITNRKKAEEQLRSSEEKLRLMVDNVKDYAIYIVNGEGIIQTWNSGAEKMKGYAAHEVIGRHISLFHTSEDRDSKRSEVFLQQAGQEGSVELEGVRVRKDGSEFWAEVALTAIYNDNGELYGFAKITRDITEKKKADEKLREVSERLSLATGVSNIGIWECDLTNNRLDWDETSYRLFGISEEMGYEGMEMMEHYLHPDDLQNSRELLAKAISEQDKFENSYRVIWPDNSIHYIFTTGLVQRDKSGKAIRLIGTNADITERKEAEEKERELLNHIQLLLDSTSEGLYGIDKNGYCTFINKEGALLLGYDTAYCKGKNMHDLIHYKKRNGQEYPISECLIAKSVEDKHSCHVESEVFWKADGSPFDVQYSSNPIIVSDERTGAVITFNDITKRKKAEAKLIESERNLNAILFSTEEGLYLLDTNFTLVLMNAASELMMKKIVNKVCKPGEDFLSFFDGDAKKNLLDVYSRVLQGHHVEAERPATLNGETFYYCVNYFPVKDENGVITNICCSSKDITQKKITEEILEAAKVEKEEFQNRFQAILDNSPQAILIKDLEGKFIFTNKRFLEAFGFDRSNIIGRQSIDVFDSSIDVEKFEEADKEVFNEKKVKEWEERVTFQNGTGIDVQFTKFPLFDSKQQFFGIGTICKDITEIKKYQHELIQAREKAEKAERLQEEFLANMSHELRTPMNGIIGMANVLSNTPLLPKQKNYLKVITQSSDTLLNLINDILDLSKIKAGMLNLEKVDFDFTETISGTTLAFKEKTLAKGIRFTVQTEPFIPKLLKGDPHRLTQILNNLLSNAIKFTEKGYVKLEASLLSQKDDEAIIEFIISDTGIGIEQNSLEAIFNSFEQASTDIARKYGGTGLGLPITRRLVEMQGGQITVASKPGVGSVFTFTLPYQIPKNNPIPVSNGYYKKRSSSEKKDYSGKQILIAEDNEINQDVLAATLKQYNLSYTIANNGKEAIEQLESGKHFDLIFMDLRMPIMNGYETTAYIREKLQLQIPIVILTASVLRNERERCFSIGASEYMVKPFKQADLNDCLHRYLQSDQEDSHKETDSPLIKTAASNAPSKYNISNLMELEDEESIKHVFQLFLDKIPQQLAELKKIAETKNRHEFLEKAHKFKGSLSIIQVPQIFQLVSLAQDIAKNNGDLQKTLPIFERAFNIYTELVPKITKDIEQHISLTSV